MQWILHSWKREFFWLYIPGPLTFVLGYVLPVHLKPSTLFLIYAFLIRDFIDSGHIYATLWRTYLDPEERVRSKIYWIAPLAFLSLFFVWIYFQMPYLATFFAYATIYHNCRQFYGISKWYQRLNNSYRKFSDFFLYVNCFMPVVLAHFRTDYVSTIFYTKSTFLLYPDQNLYDTLKLLYLAVLFCWFLFEVQLYLLNKNFELNRILSVALPSLVYGLSFTFGRSIPEILPPLVISHGLGYFAMTSLSLTKKERPRFKSFYGALAAILLTALFFGNILGFLKDFLLTGATSPIVALVMSLYLTPFFCHYVFDAFIWKTKHPDGKFIYSLPIQEP